MEFNSIAFAIFVPIVFIIYWIAAKTWRKQNITLLIASYIFYGWWDWRFLSLILFTTALTYLCALPSTHRKAWATLNICTNLAVLGFFKYFNFFGNSLQQLAGLFGIHLDWVSINILLPVGISFYTFQAISYTIDVYRRKVEPTRDFIAFAGFVAFFPQLVAGPIERATALLPQFLESRSFRYDKAVEGLRRILWGLFKKCAVADGLGAYVDFTFSNFQFYDADIHSYITVGFASVLFAVQIYADFSGYSDIAKGTAQLFGFRLMDNFLFPLYSRNGIEFWRRWHRSLMQWFTEYVYFPLGGSHRKATRNIFLVFLLSGLWHGANYTFVIWGVMCAAWYIASRLAGAAKYKVSDPCATRRDLVKIVSTFFIFAFTFTMFRSESISQAIGIYALAIPGLAILYIVAAVLAKAVDSLRLSYPLLLTILILGTLAIAVARPQIFIGEIFHMSCYASAITMLLVEWRARTHDFGLAKMPRNKALRYACYLALFYLTAIFAVAQDTPFIYFQF
jgi:D-alanyl-lipoteichoic acid acyltransferase DltB (MBOAT superfamily)